jgi:hypothetical protein
MAMSARRPLPALAFLLALSLLTALVWWRVFDRASAGTPTTPKSTCVAQPGLQLPAPGEVSLIVLNGANRAGLATSVANQLAAAGFQVGSPANDNTTVAGIAEISFGSAGVAAAKLVQYYIPGAVLLTPSSAITNATVTVSVGEAFPQAGGVNTAEQAAAAQAADAATPASAGAKPC